MTLNQIERGAGVDVPAKLHKTAAHHGKGRVIPFGPNARAVLTAFLGGRVLEGDEPIFSPKRARDERFAAMRAKRKSKVQPSQANRKKGTKRLPTNRYRPTAIAHAVQKAAQKAGVEHWHPNQLRHTFATRVMRKQHGLEAAQVLLGHAPRPT